MPAPSKAAQAAAGMAHAVEKGEMPKSKLKGASKQMYQSMKGTGELHKMAKTGSTKDLPQHVKESTEAVANLFGRTLIGEGGHKAGCQCGFCKNKGSFGKKKDADKDMDEPKEPETTETNEAYAEERPWVDSKTGKTRTVQFVRQGKPGEGKPKPDVKKVGESGTDVKLSKGVNLGGKAASAYHNMTSKQAMTPGWKTKAYVKAAGEVSGMNKSGQVQGFKNKSAGETTSGKKLPKTRPGESRVPGAAAKQIVEALLG